MEGNSSFSDFYTFQNEYLIIGVMAITISAILIICSIIVCGINSQKPYYH